MSVAVTVGATDEGKDVSQWLRVTCFGDTAKAIAARAKKGDRVYCEGTLTMNQWNDAQGEIRHGLNVAAWKCERVSNIGKNRERKPGAYQASDAPAKQREPELNDAIPF
jgi:single-stranded DNA-binding protein